MFCIRFARNEQYTTGSYGSTIYSMLESLYLIEVAAKKKITVCCEKKFLGFSGPIYLTAHSVPLQTQNKQFIEFNVH